MNSRAALIALGFALALSACTGKFTPNVPLTPPDPLTVYKKKRHLKAFAQNGNGDWAMSFSYCAVKRAVEDVMRRCANEHGGCQLAMIGPHEVDGVDAAGIGALMARYQKETRAKRSAAHNTQSTDLGFAMLVEASDGSQQLSAGEMAIDQQAPCFGRIESKIANQRCVGEWVYGKRREDANRFPNWGDLSLACEGGRNLAGTYWLVSRGLGKAELSAADGATARIIFSDDIDPDKTTPASFDAFWRTNAF